MRAKNEFKFIAEAYDTKLLYERIVDGKLMCPEACCGAPVIECTCGKDCPHCNCFMIHKAMKSKDFTDKLLKEGYDDSDAALWKKQMKHQPDVSPEELERIKKQKPAPQGRLTMPGDKDRDDMRTLKEMQRDIMNGMTAKESMEGMGIHPANQKSLLAKYMEFSKGSEGPIETGFEDEEEIDIGTMVTWNQDGPMKGEVVDVDVEQGFAVVETGFGIPPEKYVVELGELTKAIPRKPRKNIKPAPGEDNEENTHKEPYTSNYLSEQKSSDKRNIKPRTENQSFKERYKPKTHWQLEELRRMGL